MFFVNDGPIWREQRIRMFLQREPAIAVLLAAAHFEWTLCRAVLFLSKTPNVVLREKIAGYYRLDRNKELWCEEVTSSIGGEPLPQIVKNWSVFKEAFAMRNLIIHGRSNCTRNMATPKVEVILQAADDIRNFCATKGKDIYTRLPIRRKPSYAI
jgi:hypothetical protein